MTSKTIRNGLGLATALAAAMIALLPAEAASIFVTTDITVSETWTADNEYILDQPIYVTNGATLTIEAGTVVRGEPESGVGNDPGTLIITRGSKIQALGNAGSPIVFTNLDDDNVGGSSGSFPYDDAANARGITESWGGVVLLGRSYVANNTAGAPNAARTVQIEGLTAEGGLGLYGGSGLDDDDSGTMTYVSVRYGGFNLSANNEINGITCGAVGRQTDLDYLEVFQNKDDGIEFFGGTVEFKHLVVASPGDDGVDYDEGYRGKGQFILLMQGTPGSDKSDKGAEQDGGISPDNSQPFSIPTFYNATMIGQGQKAYTDKAKNTALQFRDNAGGRWYNSFFADFGGTTLLIEGGATTGTDPGTSGQRAITPYVSDAFHQGPPSSFQLELQDNTFWCFGNASTVPTAQADAVAAGGDASVHHNNGAFTNSALDNQYLACATALPIRGLHREIVGGAVPDPVDLLDPRAVAGGPLTATNRLAPPDDPFFEAAPYRGAFDVKTNWALGWTNMSRLGYFPAKPEVTISSDITTSQTWTQENVYVLDNPIYVTNGATLTIEAGTIVRGQPESGVGNDPGTLVITRGSKIQAIGTEEKPIVFTNLDDDNIGPNAGSFPYDSAENARGITETWGGVVLLGRSYVANNTAGAPNAARTVQIEGLTAEGGLGLYGGSGLDDDDSGTMTYVSVRYGGFNLSANNEINGITCGAVGRQTDLDNLEVFQNKDDGIEFFGGTVEFKHLVVASPGDDGVDYDEGYRGKGQFILLMQGTPGSDKSDKGAEQDGGISPDNSQPFSIPTFYNATMIGQGQKAYTDKAKNTALQFRDNAGGRWYNSFFADFGGTTLLIEGGATTGTDPGTSGQRAITPYVIDAFHQGPPSSFQLELQDNTFWCFGNASTVPTAQADAVAAGGDASVHHDNGAFTNATLENQYLSCATALPIRELTREPVGGAVPDPVVSLDPRPVESGGLDNGLERSTNRQAPLAFGFTPAPYRGGFSPAANWACGWTNMQRLGYMCKCTAGVGATPSEARNLVFATKTLMKWQAPIGGNTTRYDVLRKSGTVALDAADFTTASCVETDDSNLDATDGGTPASAGVFFYLVRPENPCGQGSLGLRSDGSTRTGVSCP